MQFLHCFFLLEQNLCAVAYLRSIPNFHSDLRRLALNGVYSLSLIVKFSGFFFGET